MTPTKYELGIADFRIRNEGGVWLLAPLTPEAEAWCDEHIPENASWFGSAVAVEHRFVHDIARGITSEGLRYEF